MDVVCMGNTVSDFAVHPVSSPLDWGSLNITKNPIYSRIGGNGAIFSVAVQRLGMKCKLISAVGDDIFGKILIKNLKKEGVDISSVKIIKNSLTDITIALIRDDGERVFYHYQSSSRHISSVNPQWIPKCRWFHIASFLLIPFRHKKILKCIEVAKKRGAGVSVDVSWDPTNEWVVGEIPEKCDVFMMNLHEAKKITLKKDPYEICDEMVGRGVKTVVIKMGKEGCMVATREKLIKVPAFEVKSVDCTGAGDVFAAGWVVGELMGADIVKKTVLASAAGAMSTMSYGGADGSPALKELIEFIRMQKKKKLEEFI